MKIGILVNTDKHLEDIVGLTNAALLKGYTVTVTLFCMDAGVRLIENPVFTELSKLKGVSMSFCDHDAGRFGVDKGSVPEEVVCGSQYNNAIMLHEADRVIVL
jgi:hypothetical protein